MISRDAIRAQTGSFASVVFLFFEDRNPRQHLEARLDTVFSKKKEKRTDPFTSSSLTQKYYL